MFTTRHYLVGCRIPFGGGVAFPITGTMAAMVVRGVSTVGGVGLGHKFGFSGMWIVVAIGAGGILPSLLVAPPRPRPWPVAA